MGARLPAAAAVVDARPAEVREQTRPIEAGLVKLAARLLLVKPHVHAIINDHFHVAQQLAERVANRGAALRQQGDIGNGTRVTQALLNEADLPVSASHEK